MEDVVDVANSHEIANILFPVARRKMSVTRDESIEADVISQRFNAERRTSSINNCPFNINPNKGIW